MRPISFFVILMILSGHCQAQSCLTIHGRARFYSGDGQLRIWHVGTHHEFAIYDEKSSNMLLGFLCPKEGDCPTNSPSLFADFTVCPTEKFRQGAAQPATVRSIRHPVVVPWK
jgi:hypothetical protein